MSAKDSTFFSTFAHNQMLGQRPLDIWTCTIFVSICCQFTPKGDVVNHGVDRIPIVAVLSRGSCCFTLRQNDTFLLHQPSKPKWFYGLHVCCTGPHKKVCLSFHRLTTLKCQQREAYPPGKLTYPLAAAILSRWFSFPVWWDLLLPWKAYFKGLSSHYSEGVIWLVRCSLDWWMIWIKSFPGIKIINQTHDEVVVSTIYLLFSPRSLGEWSNLTSGFQSGWFNHHLDEYHESNNIKR